jgi:hypothetical protein
VTDQAAGSGRRRRRVGRDATAVLLIAGGVAGLAAVAWAASVLAGIAACCVLAVAGGLLLGLDR